MLNRKHPGGGGFGLVALTLLAVAACQDGRSQEQTLSPTEIVAAFFTDDLQLCERHGDCVTGHCDLSPMFTVSLSSGYCLNFPAAYERWQRIELAESLSALGRADGALNQAVLERVEAELEGRLRGPEKEAVILVLGRQASPASLEMLREVHRLETGEVRRLSALTLAEAGDPTGEDDVVEASFSAVIRVRMHAARAASRLCTPTARGLVAGLLDDRSRLVRQAAAQALARCGGEEARKLLEERHKGGAPGDRFLFESATSRLVREAAGRARP